MERGREVKEEEREIGEVLTGDARPRFFESSKRFARQIVKSSNRQNALLEEQVRRARSVDGRLSTYKER